MGNLNLKERSELDHWIKQILFLYDINAQAYLLIKCVVGLILDANPQGR
jgi:hypothetical protein